MLEQPEKSASPHTSATLEHFKISLGDPGPADEVACRDCPLGIWYATGYKVEKLICFCTAMHGEKWSRALEKAGDAVLLCDAREGAIADLLTGSKSTQRP